MVSGRGDVERWTGGQATRRSPRPGAATPTPRPVPLRPLWVEVERPLLTPVAICSPQSPARCLSPADLPCGHPRHHVPSARRNSPRTLAAPALSHPHEANSVLLTHLHASPELDILNTRHLQPERRPIYLYF